MRSRDSGLPLDTRNTMGSLGNVFESLLAREGPSSALFENSQNLASSSCGLRYGTTGYIVKHERGVRQEPESSTIPTPRFNQGVATMNPMSHIGGTFSLNGMMDYTRFLTSEMHIGKFSDSLKTEVCSKSAVPHITMHWIKEVEIAKGTDDLVTSQSITRANRFPRLRYA